VVPLAVVRPGNAAVKQPGADTRLASARAMLQAGRADKADSLLKRMLHYQQDHPGALHLSGLVARRRGRLTRAVQLLEKAASLSPSSAEFWCDYGLALKAAGRHDEAVAVQRRVVGMVPNSPLALANLGSACIAAGLTDEAVGLLTQADALAPGNVEIIYNLGNAYLKAENWQQAEATFKRALEAAPAHARARVNLAVTWKEMRRLDEAAAMLNDVYLAQPDNTDAEWNLALTQLMAGDWANGWLHYEVRRHIPGFALRKVTPAPWDGAPLEGRRLLVHSEQGMGDVIQFARYLPRLGDLDGDVTVLVHNRMRPILTGLDDRVTIVEADAGVPSYDVETPMLSLPMLLGLPDPAALTGTYLDAAPDRVERWRETLPQGGKLRVGIAWQGCPDYAADHRRSIPLTKFTPLSLIEGVRLVSLQIGGGSEQLPKQGWAERVFNPGDALDADGAFLDSAAILRNLDVLVTSDTAIAHLGGAMGVETWLALAHVPDWRWGLRGETCPWYRSVRLFRQQSPGDWDGVFAAIATALRERLA
jgi:Flp pilus assembly protein TadD